MNLKATQRATEAISGKRIAMHADLLDDLSETCIIGSQAETAKVFGFSLTFIHRVLHGRDRITPKLAHQLGWKALTIYVRD